jgi:CheY-like chemotaxis protein
VATDASLFALDGSKFEASGRGVVLLIAGNGDGRLEFGEALARHADVNGLVATGLSIGICLAERYRPELVFLDLGVANVHAFEAYRVLSSLTSRAQRRCRVVAGTATVTDEVEKPALMAGAANVTLFPFASSLFQSELDRLEERLGPRKAARR